MKTDWERVLLLDLLRVVAISMVLFSHVLISIGPPWSETLQPYFGIDGLYSATWGELGVTIFLVVSGLSLEYRYADTGVRAGGFYLKRLLRVYPVYYMSLILAIAIAAALSLKGLLAGGAGVSALDGLGLDDLALTLTGLNAYAGKWGGRLVWSSWFIGLIMALYAVYPLVSRLMKKAPWATISILLGVSVISRHFTSATDILPGGAMEWFPPNRVFEFSLGVFIVRTVGIKALARPNRLLERIPRLRLLSALSFPLFLVHDPLRRFIYLGPAEPQNLIAGIPVFVALSLSLSYVVLRIDKRFSRAVTDRLVETGYGSSKALIASRNTR